MLQLFAAVLLSVSPLGPPHPPVTGEVIESFRAPACVRCAGRRGVVISTVPQSPVWAVHPGIVTFVGSVARQKYVVVEVAPNVLVTYGWVSAAGVEEGELVARGQVVAVAGARTYLGVRLRGHYVEPLRFLGFRPSRLAGPGWVSTLTSQSLIVGRWGFSR